MYSIEEIKNLMESFRENGLTDFNLEYRDFKLTLGQHITESAEKIEVSAPVKPKTEVKANVELPKQIDEVKEKSIKAETKVIKAPMVGTFYEAASPDSPVFVKVGDKVTKGQTLCILEAMKLMNEIEAEHDGTIVEILAKNEDFIEYGQSLFVIE